MVLNKALCHISVKLEGENDIVQFAYDTIINSKFDNNANTPKNIENYKKKPRNIRQSLILDADQKLLCRNYATSDPEFCF